VTADLPVAYDRLLPGVKAPRVARTGRYSPSAVVWHVGMKGGSLPDGAGHQNIHFGQAWDEAFVDLLERGRAMADPSRYVAVPSIHDKTAAPAGHRSIYVLEPVPNLHVGRIHWETATTPFRDRLHTFLGEAGYDGEIVTEKIVTPVDWQAQGMAAVRRSRSPTRSRRPVRSGRATSIDGCLGSSSPALGRPPVSESPWFSCPASSRPNV